MLARSDSASDTRQIDQLAIKELVELWFMALNYRRAEVLIGMCQPDVLIRPFRARQADQALEYRGHDGIRVWVESLDDETTISLDLLGIEVTGDESAVVEANVWLDRAGERSGGLTVSVWRFADGRLREAIGYGTRQDALLNERNDLL